MTHLVKGKSKMCLIDDAEPLDFCTEKIRTARKTHTCSECDRTIAPGEQYAYVSYGKDGEMGSNKTCHHCKIAAQWLYKHCGGYCFGSIKEELAEHYNEGYQEEDLQWLLIGISRGWKTLRGDELLAVPQPEEKAISF
jgi:ribosomal protein L24E